MHSEVCKNVSFKWRYLSLKYYRSILLLLFTIYFIAGCAESDVARQTAYGVNSTYVNAKTFVETADESNIADIYQNSPQTVKGALIGGASGAIAGAMTTGVGTLPGAATGAILGASIGALIDSTTTLEDRLENRGVNIIILGDQILIAIPSARIFDPMTSTIKPEAYSTLGMVAQFINRYATMLVKVAAYSDQTGAPGIDLALTQQQADQVSRVLEKGKVNARLLYAVGLGGTKIVTASNLAWDSDNYRIEITFEKLYV